jgi:hypothetical protein
MNPRYQFVRVVRFADVVIRALIKAVNDVREFVPSREEHDRDIPQIRIPFKDLRDLIAVRLRHHDIKEDQVRALVTSFLKGLTPRRSGDHRLPAQQEKLLQGVQPIGLIINGEDLYGTVLRHGRNTSLKRTALKAPDRERNTPATLKVFTES